ncbi:hypothetical protein COCOBI_05-2900 [Coccomyxa sp. Obi]|nr:hypothetical protein COCOBI_05-2900 [Coccomyxa sp. Obi]
MQAERNVVDGLNEDVVSAATDMHDIVAQEKPDDDETQALTRGKSVTPASQQPNPVNTAGARKKRGRPRTGAMSRSYDGKQSNKVIIQLEVQAGGDDYPMMTIQAKRNRRKSSNPKKAS